MTENLRDLYQEVILDHSRHPRNVGALPQPAHSAEGYNPLCGDHFWVHVRTHGDRIAEVHFEGEGCAISKAAASLMTLAVRGLTREKGEALFHRFQRLLTTGQPDSELPSRLAVFAGVYHFPARVKCALLPWHAFQAALHHASVPVSTESGLPT